MKRVQKKLVQKWSRRMGSRISRQELPLPRLRERKSCVAAGCWGWKRLSWGKSGLGGGGGEAGSRGSFPPALCRSRRARATCSFGLSEHLCQMVASLTFNAARSWRRGTPKPISAGMLPSEGISLCFSLCFFFFFSCDKAKVGHDFN